MEENKIYKTENKELFPENLSDSLEYQKGAKKAQEEINSILGVNENILFQLEKTKTEEQLKDKNENIKVGHSFETEIDGWFSSIEEGTIETKLARKIHSVAIEIGKNIGNYSNANTPISLKITENTDNKNGKKVYKITASNFFDDKNDEKENELKKMRDEINENDRDIVKSKYKEVMGNGKINSEFDGAGLGWLSIGMKLKDLNEKPISLDFDKQKDGTKIQITITIPEEIKKEQTAEKSTAA